MNASREPAQSIATARSTQAIPAMDVGRLGRGQDENGLIIGYWKVGICDCFSNVYPNCAMSFVCPCISLAQVTHRIGLVRFVVVLIAHGVFYGIAFIFLVLYSKQLQRAKIDVSVKKDTIDKAMQMQDTVTIVLDLLTSCAAAMSRARMYAIVSMVFFGASSVVVWFVRSNVRDAFRIPGNCLEDAAFSICCSCCAIAQVASHTESYEVHKWRIEPRDVLPGYPKVDTPITTYIAIAGGSVLAIGLLALLVVVLRRRQAAEEDEENNHRNITPREYYSEQSSNPHHNHTGGSVTSRKHLGSAQDTTSTPSTMPQSVDYLGASSRVSNPRSGNNAQHSRSSNSHTGGHPLGQYSTTGEVNEIAGYDIRFDKSMSNFRVANDEIIMGDLVASGGFGVIYRGVFAGEEIAIKKCLPDKVNNHAAMESFMLEIKLMSKLDHPNIVRFVGVAWTTLVQLKMLTEYMPRGNVRMLLQDVKKNGRSLPWVVSSATRDMPSRLRIAANVAEALVYLHLNDPPIIHRDLKSSNVLLSEDFEAKLTDFGTSRELSDEHTMTAEIGTLAWIAPEIMLGGHYTERADIYSFGVILNELDLCDLPYSNVTDARGAAISHTRLGVLVAQGKVAPQFSPQCPPWVQQMGGECLRFDPTQRPTAMQVAYRLRRAIADAK
ncbi:hypothetical protein DYB32_005088 [Aphanomyces invadans]|uniref:Protein kinase domain-containing protein n=1 Tax=Aphanomyces invadans TaxID=157072 RepID=A0A418AVI2_9STRA|nr:hypothetical protein DYB32_005088 [Aphanomyces invadans]